MIQTNRESTRFSSMLIRGMRMDSNTQKQVDLIIQAVAGQTADLVQFKDASGTVVGRVNVNGNPGTVQTAIASAAITGTAAGQLGHAAGVPLVADPGAGKVIELVSVIVSYTFVVAAYTGGGALTVNINGGAALTGSVTAANSLLSAASVILQFVPIVSPGNILVVGKGVNLVAAAAFTQPGTAAGTIKCFTTYRVHTL